MPGMSFEGDLVVKPKKTRRAKIAEIASRHGWSKERAENHRGHTLSLKFKEKDVVKWRAAAKASKENLTDWVEAGLNKLADRCLDKK